MMTCDRCGRAIAGTVKDPIYRHALWCTVGRSEPYANPMVHAEWSEDGKELCFMLDSFNFYFVDPDQPIDVVEFDCGMPADTLARLDKEYAEMLAKRPAAKRPCAACHGTGHEP